MGFRVNPKWIEQAIEEYRKTGKVSRSSETNRVIQALILALDGRSIPYKVYNLGAGVKTVTTETDTCPCCKRALTGQG